MASIGQNNKVVSLSDNNHNRGGGEPPMKNDYVTHEELDHSVDKLADKIDRLEISLNGKFDVTNSKFDTLSNRIDSLSKIVWWIMGIISTGIIIPLLAFVSKAIFNS
jgi:uncharacterized Rmd1/YagE family protein